MKIDIADKDHIWIDGVQFVSLNRMNQIIQEKGAVDYDRIQTIVYNQLVKALGVPEITEEQVAAFCKKRNRAVCDKELLDERLASQYRLGYNEGAKDADERFEALKVELLEKYKTGIEKWTAQHKDEFCTDSFLLLRAGITVGKMTLEALLKDDPKSAGYDWLD
jgi:hypothetical protein